MTAVQKRRSTTRVKTQRAAKINPARSKVGSRSAEVRAHSWLRDIVSVIFLAVAVVLLVSLVSYGYLAFRAEVVVPTDNVMGRWGHSVAAFLAGLLGGAALIPVGVCVWLALFRSREGDGAAVRIQRVHGSAVIAIALLALMTGVSALLGLLVSARWGGSVGATVQRVLAENFGWGGALLWIGLVCLVSAAVVGQRSIGDVAVALRWIVQHGARLLLVRLPVQVARGCTWAGRRGAQLTWSGLRWLGALFVSRGPVAPPVQPLPRPRLRKNAIPVLAEGESSFSVKGGEPVAVQERSDPIIVKPRPQEGVASKSLKGGRVAANPAAKDGESAPQGAPAFEGYQQPDVSLLTGPDLEQSGEDDDELRQKAEQIESKLRDFNIAGRVTQVHPGPVITLFEFEPAAGVKVGRIAALQDDLAMSLKASSIRIIAPIPKRGTVGIEVPNRNRAMVRLRECLESEAFITADSTLSVPLGKDTYGDAVVVDIATMPHLLMAGATGTGKSVCINALLLSLLYRAHPSELGLILIDPKVLELSIYDGIPHLRVPVVTDPRQAKAVLSWAVKEMDRRYRYMQKFGVRNIDGYNQIVAGEQVPEEVQSEVVQPELPLQPVQSDDDDEAAPQRTIADAALQEPLKPLPKLVIVIDELADLMLTVGREVEELITRLAQKARAAGIHLIVATQRPSVDVITGLIKANFPARLSFRVSSRIDSRTILDSMGAEKLLGKGDMLFMLPGAVPLKRVHGAFVSDQEVQKVVASLKTQCTPQYDQNIIAAVEKALVEEGEGGAEGGGGGEQNLQEEYDPFYDKAVELVVEKGTASTSMIQRVFRIGYNRAARIIEMMERDGVVGKTDGVRPREILIGGVESLKTE